VDETAKFLKALTEVHGVPGYETEVRALLRQYLEPLGEVSQDRLGSLICRLPGNGPKVMLAGHMDEIGFMVTHITKEGFLKFVQLGGWWDQTLLGHRVLVKTHRGDLVGVIGAKPPHILSPTERKKVVEKKDMYIDIGSSSSKEVEAAGVRIGDPVVPQAEFTPLADEKLYLAKAFDDRVGCAVMIDTLRNWIGKDHPNDLYGVATVMEEVGTRGAKTSAYSIDPDVAIILEVDIAGDVPGIKPEQAPSRLGAGPTLIYYDSRMIPNIKLRDLIIETADEEGIPLQSSGYVVGGGTDGGVVHLHGAGVPTVVIGISTRHIHSHGGIIHRDDYDNMVKLVTAVVGKLDADTVTDFTK
jgi:endoglucanase